MIVHCLYIACTLLVHCLYIVSTSSPHSHFTSECPYETQLLKLIYEYLRYYNRNDVIAAKKDIFVCLNIFSYRARNSIQYRNLDGLDSLETDLCGRVLTQAGTACTTVNRRSLT